MSRHVHAPDLSEEAQHSAVLAQQKLAEFGIKDYAEFKRQLIALINTYPCDQPPCKSLLTNAQAIIAGLIPSELETQLNFVRATKHYQLLCLAYELSKNIVIAETTEDADLKALKPIFDNLALQKDFAKRFINFHGEIVAQLKGSSQRFSAPLNALERAQECAEALYHGASTCLQTVSTYFKDRFFTTTPKPAHNSAEEKDIFAL